MTFALTGEYIAGFGLPGLFSYTPELSAILASIAVVVLASRFGIPPIRPAYLVLLSLIAMHLLFGIVANGVQPGTVIVGSRIYLRAIPFFILALLSPPTETELRSQFVVVLALGILQLPIAVYQRVATMARDTTEIKFLTTGDWTHGTLLNSAVLSIFLICLASVVFAMYLRRTLRLAVALPCLAALLVPTMINETKATLVLIPLAVLAVALAHGSQDRKKAIISATVFVALFTVIFVPTYDYFIKPRWGYGIIEFITMEGRIENYLSKDADIGTTEAVGRLDSLKLPVTTLKDDPVALWLGLGLGSVTESTFGDGYTGAYYTRYGSVLGPTVSRLLWEIGLAGTCLLFGLFVLIFRDSIRLHSASGAYGLLAHGWIAVLPIVFIGMFYKELILSPAISILFWYYCGCLVAAASTRSRADEPHAIKIQNSYGTAAAITSRAQPRGSGT